MNSVQGLEFLRAGRLVDAAEEVQPAVAERLGHGLVGGQHELLDDLVALGVLDHVGPGHAALLVEFHLDLGHVQFQRAVGQPPLAEGHGQRVHPARAGRRPCRPACGAGRRVVGQELVDLLVGEPLAAADGRRVQLGRRLAGPRP